MNLTKLCGAFDRIGHRREHVRAVDQPLDLVAGRQPDRRSVRRIERGVTDQPARILRIGRREVRAVDPDGVERETSTSHVFMDFALPEDPLPRSVYPKLRCRGSGRRSTVGTCWGVVDREVAGRVRHALPCPTIVGIEGIDVESRDRHILDGRVSRSANTMRPLTPLFAMWKRLIHPRRPRRARGV